MKKYIILICVVTTILSSCNKLLFEPDYASTDPQENFEYLWNECNEKYSYFDLKKIDWDSVKVAYESKISADMSNDSLFRVLGDMLNELKDGHVNLSSNFNVSFFPIQRLGQDNFDWRIIQENYLEEDYYISGPFRHSFISDGKVGYLRFSSFTGGVNSSNLDFALKRYKDTEGLVLDLRENGGGAVRDVFNLLSRFLEKETLTNYSRLKSGPGKNEFTTSEPVYVQPHDGTRYLKKVIVLIDRGSYSASSFTSLATKAIPNMILMGDTTGGGLGLPNGGELPNGWNYRFSITQALTLDKDESYEDGVPPDIISLFDWSDLTKDEVIENALLEIMD